MFDLLSLNMFALIDTPVASVLRAVYSSTDTTTRACLEYIMYAVIQSGGKQHRVIEGETLKVELLKAETGATITFDDVLMLVNGDSIQIGAPVVAGATVTAEVVSHGRHDKIRIIKMRRRKHYRKQQGHRQWFTELKITAISG